MAHSLYFVGAGLSRSLQGKKPVPLLADFIRIASEYAGHDSHLVTLIQLVGLELLGRFSWPSPKVRALAEQIDPRHLDLRVARRFLRELRRRPSESIEALLERDAPSGNFAYDAIYSPVVRFRYAISRIFAQIGWDVNLELLQLYVRAATKTDGPHTFVSFNYDLFLDRAIQKVHNTWHPHCGYGFDIPYFVRTDPDDGGVDVEQFSHDHECTSQVRILKPHGSLHWLLPVENPNAAMPYADGPVTVRVDESLLPDYVGDVLDWPRLNYPDALPTDVGPGIIAPLRKKGARLPIFVTSRALEFDAVKAAEEVYILGWSLPATDEDQLCLIGYAVQLRERPFKRVVVVNLNESPEYYDRIQRLFGVDRNAVEVWNDGFEDFAISVSAG